MIAVLDKSDLLVRYIGGGSLIHQRVVLTAARILNDVIVSKLSVRAGEWNALDRREQCPHIDRLVMATIKHDQFNEHNDGANDIALLILDYNIVLMRNIQLISLPQEGREVVSEFCFFNGWGRTDTISDDYSSVMKKVGVTVRSQCGNGVGSFLCADRMPNNQTCRGDHGAPLVCPIRGSTSRFEQVGIVMCLHSSQPRFFTNVADYVPWIKATLEYNLKINLT
ncbi:hypothetical protein KR018_009288 [Drosophila ironensis]|nr:hypothetical protein KR018_009288 [Drosophila ironensis]